MNSKNYIDNITIKYFSGNRYCKIENEDININIDNSEIIFYKKRIINTTRELIKKFTDISFNTDDNYILDNNLVNDTFTDYIKSLINAYKQDDLNDMIKNHNGLLDISSTNTNTNTNTNLNLNTNPNLNPNTNLNANLNANISKKIDNTIFSKPLNIKNKYDWSNFCKVDKKADKSSQQPMPKIGNYNLKNPSLRIKGVKNKKSKDTIVTDV